MQEMGVVLEQAGLHGGLWLVIVILLMYLDKVVYLLDHILTGCIKLIFTIPRLIKVMRRYCGRNRKQ